MLTTIHALPGWGFSADIFKVLQTEELSVQGHDYDHFPATLEHTVASLATTIPDQSIVLGWSLGGMLAIHMAQAFPDKIRKLILLASQPSMQQQPDCMGIAPEDCARFMQFYQQDASRQCNTFLRLVNYPGTADSLLQLHSCFRPSPRLGPLLSLLFSIDLRTAYQQLSVPILHLLPEQDAVIRQSQQDLLKLQPGAQHVILNGMGHGGFITEPSPCQTALRAFCHE